MKLSLSLLRRFVPIPDAFTPDRLSDLVTTSIAEVEGFEAISREGVVVARVLSVEAHPKADRLRVARVTDGQQEYQVVCGGTNLAKDQLVAFAKVGASVKWHGEGEEIVLEKATLRGVESEGMICASEEIGLKFEEGEREILDLTNALSDADVGKNLYEALGCHGEVVFEIDNKSLTHRPDLFGHYGFARDLSVVLRHQSGIAATSLKPLGLTPLEAKGEKLDIEVTSPTCQRFCGIRISGISVGPSPLWLRRTVTQLGVKSINNVVDVTNYIMAEIGKPIHAYDARFTSSLQVRLAKKGEKIKTLDNKEHELTVEDTVVANGDKLLCLGGMIGGMESSVQPDTTEILIESAAWDPVMIRKTGQRLGIRTESSTRFEKSLDPSLAPEGAMRAVELILQLCPEARISSAWYDSAPDAIQPQPISLDLSYASRLLGIPVDPVKALAILTDLGCTVEETDDAQATVTKGDKAFDIRHSTFDILLVTPPTWRSTKDLLIAEDLIEELGRVLGYGDIPYTAPEGILRPHVDQRQKFERKLRNILSMRLGYHEVENYSLTDDARDAAITDATSGIEVANPLTQETKHFKSSLIPDLLRNAALNARVRDDFRLFEVSRLYRYDGMGVSESRHMAAILVRDKRLSNRDSSYDHLFFRAKEDMERLLHSIGSTHTEYAARQGVDMISRASSGRDVSVSVDGKEVGRITAVAPQLANSLDLFDVVIFELDLDTLESTSGNTTTIVPLPKFQESVRDLALVVDGSVASSNLEKAMRSASPLVRDVHLFDVFEGKEIGEGNRSLAYRLTLGSDERTLTDQEIASALSAARKAAEGMGAKVRE